MASYLWYHPLVQRRRKDGAPGVGGDAKGRPPAKVANRGGRQKPGTGHFQNGNVLVRIRVGDVRNPLTASCNTGKVASSDA